MNVNYTMNGIISHSSHGPFILLIKLDVYTQDFCEVFAQLTDVSEELLCTVVKQLAL